MKNIIIMLVMAFTFFSCGKDHVECFVPKRLEQVTLFRGELLAIDTLPVQMGQHQYIFNNQAEWNSFKTTFRPALLEPSRFEIDLNSYAIIVSCDQMRPISGAYEACINSAMEYKTNIVSGCGIQTCLGKD